MSTQRYHNETLIGDNRVSSVALVYAKHTTYETLIEGPNMVKEADEDGYVDDSITGHGSFEEMIRFHRMAVQVMESVTGLKAN